MYYQLTKREKQIARTVIDKGLEREYLEGLKFAEGVLKIWKRDHSGTKETYLELLRGLDKIDRRISKTHDGKDGSRWVEIMASQLAGGYISMDDLDGFKERTLHMIKLLAGEEMI